jgi:hypothetical protein
MKSVYARVNVVRRRHSMVPGKQYHRGQWHWINWPLKPDGASGECPTGGPDPVNTLTALAENDSYSMEEKNQSHRQQRFILDCTRSNPGGLIVEAATFCYSLDAS